MSATRATRPCPLSPGHHGTSIGSHTGRSDDLFPLVLPLLVVPSHRTLAAREGEHHDWRAVMIVSDVLAAVMIAFVHLINTAYRRRTWSSYNSSPTGVRRADAQSPAPATYHLRTFCTTTLLLETVSNNSLSRHIIWTLSSALLIEATAIPIHIETRCILPVWLTAWMFSDELGLQLTDLANDVANMTRSTSLGLCDILLQWVGGPSM